MAASLEQVLRSHLTAARTIRERQTQFASRIVSSLLQGNVNDLSDIIREATGIVDGSSEKGSSKPLETGDANGPDRTETPPASPA